MKTFVIAIAAIGLSVWVRGRLTIAAAAVRQPPGNPWADAPGRFR